VLHWVELEGKLAQKPAGPEDELVRSEERQLSDILKEQLDRDPARWGDVLEVLSEEDPRIGRKIVGQLQGCVKDPAEADLIRLLRTGRHRETRMASATLISARATRESLWALIASSQEDPDSGVRYHALRALTDRKGRPEETVAIDQTFRLRAQVEPDPDVRRFALRVTGQTSDVPPAPARTGRAPLGRN
jgi:hypothetical protein